MITVTNEKPIRTRHTWTKAELAHLNRTVGASKTKGKAFQKIADEMGLSKTAVQGTYYNHHKPVKQDAADMAPPKAASKPRLVAAKPQIDFSLFSERELIEIRQAITSEIQRRIKTLQELESALKL